MSNNDAAINTLRLRTASQVSAKGFSNSQRFLNRMRQDSLAAVQVLPFSPRR